MANINIRLVEKKDKDRILEISSQIWDGYDYLPNVIDKWLKNEGAYLFVLEYDGLITHLCRLQIQSKYDGWVEGLRGDPAYRGRGLAKKIDSYIIDYAKEIGLKTLRASTYFKNDASIKLTTSLGFSIKYKYLLCEKELKNLNIDTSEKNIYKNNIKMLKEDDIDAVLLFLDNSEIYKKHYIFYTDGWHYEVHSKEIWMKALKDEKLYAVKSDKIEAMMLIDKSIGFIDGDKDSIEILLDFAEQKTYIKNIEMKDKNSDENYISCLAPANTFLIDLIKDRGYQPWEPTEENANVYVFEMDI